MIFKVVQLQLAPKVPEPMPPCFPLGYNDCKNCGGPGTLDAGCTQHKGNETFRGRQTCRL